MDVNNRASGLLVLFIAIWTLAVPGSLGMAQDKAAAPAAPSKAEAPKGESIKATQSYPSAILERASSGATNIVYGPLELIYQFKEEIKRTDPLRGVVPGVAKGAGWFVTREVVGIFELVTFFLPYKPVLKEFDTEWIYV